jgi:hypothetical protein
LEAHLKVVIVEALLRSGHEVLEGSSRNTGKRVFLAEGGVRTVNEPLPHMVAATGSIKTKNSPDIRVWAPARLVLELQVRSILGTQDSLFSDNLVDDLDRVQRGAADALEPVS